MPNNPNAAKNLIPAKKGEVRNPKGKPKGTIHLSTRIQNMLDDDEFSVDHVIGGERFEFKGNPAEAIIKTAIIKARNGDKQWADWLAQNGYGNKLSVEVTDTRKDILERYGLPYAGQAEEAESRPPEDTA